MERIITEGDEFYATALRMIRGAARSVYVGMYIIQDDEIGRTILKALAARARAGLRVHLVFDAVGSSAVPPETWETLRASGAVVLAYLPFRRSRLRRPLRTSVGWWRWLQLYFLRRNHRKIFIFDERVAMTGGFNITRECSRKYYGEARWQDVMYLTDLEPVVRELIAIHLDSMRRAYRPGLDLRTAHHKRVREAILYPPAPRALPWLPDLFYESDARVRSMGIARSLKQRIRRSRRRVYLMFPYFIPYGGFIRLLARKAAAGLDVRIYLSRVSDLPWIQEITLYHAAKLHRQGVRVFLFHGGERPGAPARFNHSKAVLVDAWAGTGSSNFDGRSFQLNLETFVWRHRPEFLARFEEYFAWCESHSEPGDEVSLKSGWRARLLHPFRRFL